MSVIWLLSPVNPQQGAVEADRSPLSAGEHIQRHRLPQCHRVVQWWVFRPSPVVGTSNWKQQHGGNSPTVQDVSAVRYDGYPHHCVAGVRGLRLRCRGCDNSTLSRLATGLRLAFTAFSFHLYVFMVWFIFYLFILFIIIIYAIYYCVLSGLATV